MVLLSWQYVRKFEECGRSNLNIILRKKIASQITFFPLRTKDQSPGTLNNSTVSGHKSCLTSVSLRNIRHSCVWHQNLLFHPVIKTKMRMIHKTLSFKGCKPAGSRRCWKEEWSRGERSLGWRQSTRKLCRDFSRCSLSVELLDAPRVWNVPNLWLLSEILMVVLKCRSLGGDITVLVIAQHLQQLCPCFLSDLRAELGLGCRDWNQDWFLITARVLCDAPGAAELGLGSDSKCGWMNQAEKPVALDSLAVSGVLCGSHVLSCISLFFRRAPQGSETPPPAAAGSSSTLQVRLSGSWTGIVVEIYVLHELHSCFPWQRGSMKSHSLRLAVLDQKKTTAEPFFSSFSFFLSPAG